MIQSRFPLLVLAGALLGEIAASMAQETPVAFVGAVIIPVRADLALFDGDPFEYTTHCTTVIIAGVVTDTQPH